MAKFNRVILVPFYFLMIICQQVNGQQSFENGLSLELFAKVDSCGVSFRFEVMNNSNERVLLFVRNITSVTYDIEIINGDGENVVSCSRLKIIPKLFYRDKYFVSLRPGRSKSFPFIFRSCNNVVLDWSCDRKEFEWMKLSNGVYTAMLSYSPAKPDSEMYHSRKTEEMWVGELESNKVVFEIK